MQRQQPRASSSFVRQGSESNELKELRFFLKQYSSFDESINSPLGPNLIAFTKGDLADIDQKLLEEEFAILRKILIDPRKFFSKKKLGNPLFPYKPGRFKNFNDKTLNVLDGIKKGITIEEKNIRLSKKVEKYEKILKDKESISAYIKERFGAFVMFKDIEEKLTVRPTFKPQYDIYLQRYGKPPEGRFDQKLLAEIEKELNL